MAKWVLVTEQVTESRSVLECEAERLSSFIKAENPEVRWEIMKRAQDGNGIGSGAKTNIPNDELALAMMIF